MPALAAALASGVQAIAAVTAALAALHGLLLMWQKVKEAAKK